jgi:heat shock protein HslJ
VKTYTIIALFLGLAVLLSACASPVPTATPTSGGMPSGGPTDANVPALHRTWQWNKRVTPSSGAEEAIDDPSKYVLTFKADGNYDFQADCNKGSGTYVADGKGAIRLTAGPVTMAACGEGSRDQDFMNMMYAVQDYRLEDNGATLVMVWPAGGPEDVYK